jgi:hypothetical protein
MKGLSPFFLAALNLFLMKGALGDYGNLAIRPNAQISQIFDLAKSDALPHFLAKSGQI